MKKILSIILLAILVFFTGCSSSSSDSISSAEAQEVLEYAGGDIFLGLNTAYTFAYMDEISSGVAPGFSRATMTLPTGISYTYEFSGDSDSFILTVSITFDEYEGTYSTTNGNLTYTVTGNAASFSATIVGDFTTVYNGTSYSGSYNLVVGYDGSDYTFTGTVTIGGTTVSMSDLD